MNGEVVRDYTFSKRDALSLIKEMKVAGGFTAKKVYQAFEIIRESIEDKNCLKFLSFPACIMATGTRGAIKEIVKRKWCDIIITTSGTLDHDLARLWKDYYHGSFLMDDRELHKKGINRLGNILIPNESYSLILEEKLQDAFSKIFENSTEMAPYQLIWEIGKYIEKFSSKKEDSVIYWAYKNNVPIFIPGFFDGAFGFQLYMFWNQNRNIKINFFMDEDKLAELIFQAEDKKLKTFALMVGGGISKHHVIWWNQFKGGLDKAVYITTAQEYDGSLSGARLREAISWGKLSEKAKFATIQADATLVLPLIVAALIDYFG
ncbi:MAG TPA: deoxyhypusine synthase [Candidatus Altiarchaeales archaeon]|nr:MAG: deoxyhypusine synthase [Candidatus Altiarchaeales archaeon]HDN83533.1 deoxyhypusine synthase [Candidatus Altiarchaeales archaeon]